VAHRFFVLALAEEVKGIDDTDDRAEEADERRVVADGAHRGHAALELPALLAHLGFERFFFDGIRSRPRAT